MPLQMDEIYTALDEADLFLSIGTSGNVYPAAGFVSHVRQLGKAVCTEINLEPSEAATLFHDINTGKAGTLTPQIVDHILSGNYPSAHKTGQMP